MAIPLKSTRVSQRPATKPKKGVQKKQPSQPRAKKETLPVDQRRRSSRTTSRQTEVGKKVVKLEEEDSSLSKEMKKDPMQVLHYDVIALIIFALDPADTETMRRVSKLWKAVSERHCGNGLLLKHFPSACSIYNNNLSREQANLVYRRRLYRSKNLNRAMATRAVNITNVIDWHIMGDRLVYWIKPGGGICVHTLRGPNGEACKISESTTFKLKKEIGNREMMTVFVQSLKDGDLLITACSKSPSSAGSPNALHEYTFLMRVSLREERMKYYSNDDLGEYWYLIEEDNLTFGIELHGQIIGRPALGQDCAYFVQNRSTNTSKSQPRFTKISLADGTILFSKIMPEIKEAGIIHESGRSFTPELSDDAKVSNPGRAIEIPQLDRQMVLAKSEDFAIWSDPELRMYVFCTDTGTLLYTYDCDPDSSVTMCSFVNGFWYRYCRDSIAGPYFTHHFCSFSKSQGRVLFGPPLLQDNETSALMDDECIDLRVEHERYDRSVSQEWGDTLDPFTKFRISTMEWLKAVMFNPDSEQEHHLVIEMRDLPYKLVTLGRGTRYLEAEIPFSGSDEDICQMVNGYLVYSNTLNNQLILIDFYPEW